MKKIRKIFLLISGFILVFAPIYKNINKSFDQNGQLASFTFQIEELPSTLIVSENDSIGFVTNYFHQVLNKAFSEMRYKAFIARLYMSYRVPESIQTIKNYCLKKAAEWAVYKGLSLVARYILGILGL